VRRDTGLHGEGLTGPSREREHHSRRFGAPFSVIAAVYLILSAALAATASHFMHGQSPPLSVPSSTSVGFANQTPRYLVLMVLDGARPDYLNVTTLPHVAALRAEGTYFSKAFDGILEAETPSGHTAIATGSQPAQNGILGFDWANDNDRYSIFSPTKMSAMEQIISESHSPTIGGLYKAHFPRAKVVAVSGHKYYAAAPLGGPNADAII
jgi:hypothetical protein